MSQFAIHSAESAPKESRPLIAQVEKAFGFVPNLIGALAESPVALEAYLTLGKIFGKSSLTPAERNEVYLVVSALNECAYCTAAHTASAPAPDSDPARIEALRIFTRAVVEKRGWAGEEDIQRFLDAGFTKANVLDVATGVAQKIISNYTNHIAKTPVDEAFLK